MAQVVGEQLVADRDRGGQHRDDQQQLGQHAQGPAMPPGSVGQQDDEGEAGEASQGGEPGVVGRCLRQAQLPEHASSMVFSISPSRVTSSSRSAP